MDLSFARLDSEVAVTALPTELAVLLVGVTARQAASPAARVAALIAGRFSATPLLAPPHGSFNAATAALLSRGQGL